MAITTKTSLRIRARETRNALAPEVRIALSGRIAKRLFKQRAWGDAETVLAYASFGSEVETKVILQHAIDSGKRLVLPLGDPLHQRQELCQLKSLDDFVAGPHTAIIEPDRRKGGLVKPSEVDIAVLPGLLFDRSGARIGLGGGFYDRLLPKLTKALRVAIAFSAQIAEALPTEPHDQRVQAICTETEWIEI